MSYYTVVDKCPFCNNLQKRWITNTFVEEKHIKCTNCETPFPLDSSMFQIILNDSIFS